MKLYPFPLIDIPHRYSNGISYHRIFSAMSHFKKHNTTDNIISSKYAYDFNGKIVKIHMTLFNVYPATMI